jgi:class 3 adenylate cyclase/tetratricopeptide (TPR) repeat protein
MNDSPSLPSGLVTFMFTDIVGSTDLKGKMPGATSGERQTAFREKVKAPHDAIITESVRAHGGFVIKGTGDGYLIAFSDAEKALLSALEIQRQIESATIFTPSGALKIRMGLNSGQAEPINNDYTASAVDKAARVESKCQPGKVYLSRETHELTRGKVRGVSAASVGSHDLKGLAKEELFVAFTEASTAILPPVDAQAESLGSTTIRNNLPRLQSFFGREKELAIIADALTPQRRTWGVLIDGPGGIGKTSLAIRAAELVPSSSFFRILFLSAKEREMTPDGKKKLTGFILPGYLEMLNEIARQLKVERFAERPETDRPRLLLDVLADEHALLILDNLESLIPEHRDNLFTFLGNLPQGCKAIVTSRRRTDVDARIIRLEKLEKQAALGYLAELAEGRPHLQKATDTERVQLYEETGGNPLVIRWLVGQLGKGRCKTVAKALEFLRSAPTDNDPLEFIFGDLLETFTESEEKVLAALAFFTAPIGAPHISELSALSNTATLTALDDLADRALVAPDAEQTNFILVPLVADFLRRVRPGIIKETGGRLEQRAYALIVENGYRKYDRFPVLDSAWPTVAPALPLFMAGPNRRLQKICHALIAFLEFTGRWDEWLLLNLQGEAVALAVGDHDNAGWRAKDAGYIHQLRGDADSVLASADRAAAHWNTANAGPRERAIAVLWRGYGYRLKQDYAAAIEAFGLALNLFRSVSLENEGVAASLSALSFAENLAGDRLAADRDLREALRVARAIGDAEGVASYTGNLAARAVAQEDWLEAEKLAREALTMSEELGRRELIAENSYRLAKALERQGKPIDALPHARRAVEILTKLGSGNLARACAVLSKCEG